MKNYYKYSYGYINIDDENLYMTNSGNWQEARETQEKTPKTVKSNSWRSARMSFFIFGFMVIVAIFLILIIKNGTLPLIGLGIMGGGLYFVNKRFTEEKGSRYRIPLSKLIRMEAIGTDTIKIHFYNGNNQADSERIEGLQPNGFTAISQLVLPEKEN